MPIQTIIYISAAVISLVIALVLIYLAKLSVKAKIEEMKRTERMIRDATGDEDIRENIYKQVNEIISSKRVCQEVSQNVMKVFSGELERKANQKAQELSKHYNKIVQEKARSEEIAWGKYKKTLTDKKETEAVIHSISEGLIVVDKEGKVIMLNPAAEKLLGVAKKDKIGKPILEGLKAEQLVSLIKGAPGEEKREIELNSQQDETKKILRASSAVVEDENGKTVGMASVLSDVTKQKELDRLKSNFVANISHELRTPLVGIEKAITLMLDKSAGEINSNQEQFLIIAKSNLKRLSVMINDLLDLAKLEAGKMKPKFESLSIESLIKESIDSLNAWANTKHIKIEKEIQQNLPHVNVDSGKIMQVLNNLLGNAIKFTPSDGKITVRAVSRKENDKDKIEISIEDTGIGIAKEDLDKIFDKFYQTGERSFTDITGTGIGLSIAKEIVELHGGNIRAESEKGKGTKFIFILPVNRGG